MFDWSTAFGSVASTASTTRTTRDVGWEIDLDVSYPLFKNLDSFLSLGYFQPGAVYARPDGSNPKTTRLILATSMVAVFAVSPEACSEDIPYLNVFTERLCTPRPPPVFALRAEATGLVSPLKFHWDLGNEQVWEGQHVPPQAYDFGRYNVILSVTDATGRTRRASLTIDASAPGCGGI